jgi:putative peptide zinc metalloprotease protein
LIYITFPLSTGLLSLDSPDTRARGARADAASATLWLQLQRANATPASQENRSLLSSRLQQELAESRGASEEVERLVLKAPFSGQLADLDPLVQPGVWVNPGQLLGTLVDTQSWIVDAYVSQSDVRYLRPGDSAKVYLASRSSPVAAAVIGIDSARTLTLPDSMLDAAHGGPIRASTINNRQEIQQALYRVRLRLAHPPASLRTELARVVIYGRPHALAAEWLRNLASVAIRESGF